MSREEPLGVVGLVSDMSERSDLCLWNFDSLLFCLIIEKRVYDKDENGEDIAYAYKSEWHLVDDLKVLDFLFNFLNANSINSNLINGLLSVIENIKKKATDPLFQINTKNKDSAMISNRQRRLKMVSTAPTPQIDFYDKEANLNEFLMVCI